MSDSDDNIITQNIKAHEISTDGEESSILTEEYLSDIEFEAPLIPLTNELDPIMRDELYVLNEAIEKLKIAGYPKSLIDQLVQSQVDATTYKGLDHDLIRALKDLCVEDNTKVYEKNKYIEVTKTIDSNSFVIYFKKAGIFKVYSPEKLKNYFHGQVSTRHNLKETDIYEVVDRNHPQKIIVIIDGSIREELTKIRDYVYTYFSRYDDTLDRKDIITLEDPLTKTLEILVNGLYVKNYEDKETFIRGLLKYIEDEERKIGFPFDLRKIETWRVSDIPNTDMYLIPQKKNNNNNNNIELMHKYVSSVQNCRLLGNTVINININTNVNSNNVNSTSIVGNSNLVQESETNDDLQVFIDYIKENKPSWYTPNKWIFTTDIYDKFIEICNSNMTKNKFSRDGQGILFSKKENKYIQNKQGRAMLLLPYNKL